MKTPFERYKAASKAGWDIREEERQARKEMDKSLAKEARRLQTIARRAARSANQECNSWIMCRGHMYIDHSRWVCMPMATLSIECNQTKLATDIFIHDPDENAEQAREFGRQWAAIYPMSQRYDGDYHRLMEEKGGE